MRAAAITLIVCALSCSNSNKQTDMTQPHTQPALEDVLAKAVADGADPKAVVAAVGKPALIDTTRPGDRNVIRMADIRPDPKFQLSLPPLGNAENVVYWKVEENAQDVIVVGVYWLPGAHGVVFRGLIGPP